jgi:hypothetical protein
MMRDKGIWGDDANAFIPDRWLKEDSAELDKFYMPASAHLRGNSSK